MPEDAFLEVFAEYAVCHHDAADGITGSDDGECFFFIGEDHQIRYTIRYAVRGFCSKKDGVDVLITCVEFQ